MTLNMIFYYPKTCFTTAPHFTEVYQSIPHLNHWTYLNNLDH